MNMVAVGSSTIYIQTTDDIYGDKGTLT